MTKKVWGFEFRRQKTMDWNEVLKDIVSGTIMLAIGGIGGWFGGVIKV